MGFFALFDGAGRCVTSGYCLNGQESIQGGDQYISLITDELISVHDWFLHKGVLTRLPERPSSNHFFDYEVAEWVFDEARAWSAVRFQREHLIAASDWRIARATEKGQPIDARWKAYRQALRDITEQPDPNNIQWPTAPEEDA
ncbi:MAG: tail fiber assembly protein [Comamonas sp.]